MTSSFLASIAEGLAPLFEFVNNSAYSKRWGDPEISDFVFGNPHDKPLPAIAEALRTWADPQDKNWFAYKMNEPEPRTVIVQSLQRSHGIRFEEDDIFLTPGAFGGISVALRALCDPGDEVIFLSPPWFFYEAMIRLTGATPVRVALEGPDFAVDPLLIAKAITDKTRAIIVNTPHNPTGRIYTRTELDAIAEVLRAAPRTIYLLADEAYRRIVFSGEKFVSAASAYDATLVIYTYGKTLLAPGERIGYVAIHPNIENRTELRAAMTLSQMVGGWQFPNAILQRAIGDLDPLSIDIDALQARRDKLAAALSEAGYELILPAGTFYMMVKSPLEDDDAFAGILAEYEVFVGPGHLFEMPGWFRISLTANDEMVAKSIPGFAAAINRVR